MSQDQQQPEAESSAAVQATAVASRPAASASSPNLAQPLNRSAPDRGMLAHQNFLHAGRVCRRRKRYCSLVGVRSWSTEVIPSGSTALPSRVSPLEMLAAGTADEAAALKNNHSDSRSAATGPAAAAEPGCKPTSTGKQQASAGSESAKCACIGTWRTVCAARGLNKPGCTLLIVVLPFPAAFQTLMSRPESAGLPAFPDPETVRQGVLEQPGKAAIAVLVAPPSGDRASSAGVQASISQQQNVGQLAVGDAAQQSHPQGLRAAGLTAQAAASASDRAGASHSPEDLSRRTAADHQVRPTADGALGFRV